MTELVASRSAANVLQTSIDRLTADEAVATRGFLTALQSLPKFIFDIARTLDEHDTDMERTAGAALPGKRFPDWPYLHELIDLYETERLLFVEKARQLMVTWLFAAVVVWEVRHKPGQRWAWVSLKSDHADEALARMWTIVERLPGRPEKSALGHTGFRDAGGVLWTRSYCRIALPQMSGNVHGMSQNASDARSFTMSGFVFDEWAHQPNAREGFSAAKPTIDTGRCVGITTPGPFGVVHDISRGKVFGVDEDE